MGRRVPKPERGHRLCTGRAALSGVATAALIRILGWDDYRDRGRNVSPAITAHAAAVVVVCLASLAENNIDGCSNCIAWINLIERLVASQLRLGRRLDMFAAYRLLPPRLPPRPAAWRVAACAPPWSLPAPESGGVAEPGCCWSSPPPASFPANLHVSEIITTTHVPLQSI